jgi:succinate dehydrogenase/fumarate reductase flavoprotein subunit
MTEQPWLPAAWDRQADVVVVGFGAAGAATAITAHDAGAKVVLAGQGAPGA